MKAKQTIKRGVTFYGHRPRWMTSREHGEELSRVLRKLMDINEDTGITHRWNWGFLPPIHSESSRADWIDANQEELRL